MKYRMKREGLVCFSYIESKINFWVVSGKKVQINQYNDVVIILRHDPRGRFHFTSPKKNERNI